MKIVNFLYYQQSVGAVVNKLDFTKYEYTNLNFEKNIYWKRHITISRTSGNIEKKNLD